MLFFSAPPHDIDVHQQTFILIESRSQPGALTRKSGTGENKKKKNGGCE